MNQKQAKLKPGLELLRRLLLPEEDLQTLPSSELRFSDGAQYRIEIPSTEGPESLRAVLDEGKSRQVPVHRTSQGSGIMLLTDAEIREMVQVGQEAAIEMNLFIGPRATFDTGAQVFSPAGKALGLSLRGSDQLRFAILDTLRAVELGCRSILVSDIGLLQVLGQLRSQGDLPADLILKTSVMMAPTNPASARLLETLGANTINIPSDISLPQLASMRAALRVPIDFYIESPDNIGGFIRYYEIPEIIRIASPVYLKFGLRNSPDIYPSGTHIQSTAVALSRERVRRAQIAMEMIQRYCPEAVMSAAG